MIELLRNSRLFYCFYSYSFFSIFYQLCSELKSVEILNLIENERQSIFKFDVFSRRTSKHLILSSKSFFKCVRLTLLALKILNKIWRNIALIIVCKLYIWKYETNTFVNTKLDRSLFQSYFQIWKFLKYLIQITVVLFKKKRLSSFKFF